MRREQEMREEREKGRKVEREREEKGREKGKVIELR